MLVLHKNRGINLGFIPLLFPHLMFSYFVDVRIKSYRKNKKGESALYLRIGINQQRFKMSLNLFWPSDKFDEKRGVVLPKFRGDGSADDINLVISNAVSKANEIFTHYRLKKQLLTVDQFKKDFYSQYSAESFSDFMHKEINLRWERGEISKQTKKNHLQAYEKLVACFANVKFNDFQKGWAERLEKYLKKEKLAVNTRWTQHKFIKVYLRRAEDDGQTFYNPYRNFKVKQNEGKHAPLSKEELKRVLEYYNDDPPERDKIILRRFLFSCFTGLRISDLKRLTQKNRIGNILVFTPYKTRDRVGELLQIPMAKQAILLWNEEEMETETGEMFRKYSEQQSNKNLKRISENLGLSVGCTHQTARETFATLSAEIMPLQVVQTLLGHTKITTTRKYVKVSFEEKQRGVEGWDKLLEE